MVRRHNGHDHDKLDAFAQVEPSVVSAAAQLTRSKEALSKVEVEFQTRFGSTMRVRGALDASFVCQLAQILCINEGGR